MAGALLMRRLKGKQGCTRESGSDKRDERPNPSSRNFGETSDRENGFWERSK